MKVIQIHKSAAKELSKIPFRARQQAAELLDLIAHGESLGMPVSRPMPTIQTGVHELRIKERSGQYRIFYYTKLEDRIVVFHCFQKKTQATPKKEIDIAKQRLKEMI